MQTPTLFSTRDSFVVTEMDSTDCTEILHAFTAELLQRSGTDKFEMAYPNASLSMREKIRAF